MATQGGGDLHSDWMIMITCKQIIFAHVKILTTV